MPRTDTAARTVPAPTDRVFAALTDAEALAEWLPPEGMRGRFERFDMRPGGSYRMVLEYLDAREAGKTGEGSDAVEARIVEIVPGERVVQEVEFESDDPAFSGVMMMTWAVEPAAEGSTVRIRAEGVPSGISAAEHAVGLASSLANLAAYLAR